MKKVNFKQPKYILPLVIFLPLVFLGYTISNFFGEDEDAKKGVVTDNINMTLPDARNGEMTDKMTEMSRRFSEDGAYTAIGALGSEKEELDSTQAGNFIAGSKILINMKQSIGPSTCDCNI